MLLSGVLHSAACLQSSVGQFVVNVTLRVAEILLQPHLAEDAINRLPRALTRATTDLGRRQERFVLRGVDMRDTHKAKSIDACHGHRRAICRHCSLVARKADQFGKAKVLAEAQANFARFSLPMLELAREHDIPVFAANAPRRYVKQARLEGYDSLKALPAEEQALFRLPEALDEGDYRDRLKALLIENGIDPTDERLLPGQRAQEVWDATMADSVSNALERGGEPVLLVVGRFHGDFGGGTIARIEGMRPGVDVRYVVMVGSPSGPLRTEDRGRADFVIYTDARRANE